MAKPTVNATADVWRAEDAIRDIFSFVPDERLELDRSTCLSWIKDGSRRCTFFTEMNWPEVTQCDEHQELIHKFLTRTAPEVPMTFKKEVKRFIELACCYIHVTNMTDAADNWFKKHGDDVAPVDGIEMKPYVRGKHPEQLRRFIDKPLKEFDKKPGQVYIWVSPDVPGYIKIGYTTLEVLGDRFQAAQRDCSIRIVLMYNTGLLSHPRRLEKLVHHELADVRYRFANPCTFCIQQAKAEKHDEWFLTTVERARSVADYWKVWLEIGIYNPQDGSLSTTMREQIRLLASPEQIKNRERLFSLEPGVTQPAAFYPSPRSVPNSPTPKGSVVAREAVVARAVSPTPLKEQDAAKATSHAPSPLPKPIETKPNGERAGHNLPKARTTGDRMSASLDTALPASMAQPKSVTKTFPEAQVNQNKNKRKRDAEDHSSMAPAAKPPGRIYSWAL